MPRFFTDREEVAFGVLPQKFAAGADRGRDVACLGAVTVVDRSPADDGCTKVLCKLRKEPERAVVLVRSDLGIPREARIKHLRKDNQIPWLDIDRVEEILGQGVVLWLVVPGKIPLDKVCTHERSVVPRRTIVCMDGGAGEPGHQAPTGGQSTAVEGGLVRRVFRRTYPRLFLASRSPRRRELLDEHGIVHEAEHPGFDDSILRPGAGTPRTWVTSLAHLKARAGLEILEKTGRTSDFEYVLGADTTCVRDGDVLGTPASAQEAAEILRALAGGVHEVITGVALVKTRDGRRYHFADSAWVTWGRVNEAMIAEYIASERWKGKAGAYNLHERIAAGWPITFQGDASTITGLPMGMLTRVLCRLGESAGEGWAARDPVAAGC
jgi:septum formation protein